MTCDANADASDTSIDVYSDCDTEQQVGTQCVGFNDDYCGFNAAVVLNPSDSGYYLFVSGNDIGFDGQNFTLTVQNNRNQTNDRCWQGSRVFNIPSDYSGNLKNFKFDTTLQCGQQASRPRHGAWFSYVNQRNFDLEIGVSTCNAENVGNATIEVFTGCISCYKNGHYDSDAGCSTVTFTAKPGVNYSIFVSTIKDAEDNFYHVDFYYDYPNWNQFCNTSINVTRMPYYSSAFTGTSALSYSTCDGGKEWKGMWYRIRGTGNKIRAATIDGSTHFDTLLELHSDCPVEGGNTCLMMNDDSSHQGFASSLDFDTEQGKFYYLFVRGAKGETGLFSMNIYEMSEPNNSQCTSAPRLRINRPTVGVTSFASPSVGACTETPRQGLWYTTSIRHDAPLYISTCDAATAFDTDIEVYTGCDSTGGTTCVDHEHDYKCPKGTIISFPATANVTYYIFVTANRSDLNESGLFRITAIDMSRPNYTSDSSSSPSGSGSVQPVIEPSSSSKPDDHGVEAVEIMLIIFTVALVGSVGFAIGCCIYKRPSSKSYVQMDVPDGLDTNQSSSYVAPDPVGSINSDSGVSL